jgi:ketosteroid isomerase-like protein
MKTRLLAALLTLGSVGWAAPASADMKSDVTAAYGAWDAAFNKGDAKAVAAFYAADAKYLPADHTCIQGPADVEKFFAGLFSNGVKSHKLESITIGGTDTQPFAAAKWSVKAGDKDIGGVATHIFERQPGGSLKLKLHTFN